jgi:asparaginyl-tRNA synthetase
MEQTYIEDIARKVGQEVLICGWLYNRRESGKIQFLLIRDGTGVIQGVVTKADGEAFEKALKLTQESSLKVWGTVRADQRAPESISLPERAALLRSDGDGARESLLDRPSVPSRKV